MSESQYTKLHELFMTDLILMMRKLINCRRKIFVTLTKQQRLDGSAESKKRYFCLKYMHKFSKLEIRT